MNTVRVLKGTFAAFPNCCRATILQSLDTIIRPTDAAPAPGEINKATLAGIQQDIYAIVAHYWENIPDCSKNKIEDVLIDLGFVKLYSTEGSYSKYQLNTWILPRASLRKAVDVTTFQFLQVGAPTKPVAKPIPGSNP